MAPTEGSFQPPTAPPGAEPPRPMAPPVPARKPDEPVWGIVAVAAAVVPMPLWLFGEIQDIALFASLIGAVVAIVFGAIGIGRTRDADSMLGRALAIAGLVLGIVEVALAVLVVLFIIVLFAAIFAACASCGQVAFFGVGMTGSRPVDWNDFITAHHPETACCAEDVYVLAGRRWCVGCTTGITAFVATFALLLGAGTWLPWWLGVVGLPLGAAQFLSLAGWTRSRAAKAFVKAVAGVGLALVVWATGGAPVAVAWKVAMVAFLVLGILGSGAVRAARVRWTSRA